MIKIETSLLSCVIQGSHKTVIPNYFFEYFECDLFAVTKAGYSAEYEIKKTKADYYKDFEKQAYGDCKTKHELIQSGKRTNRFYFVIPEELKVEIPKYAGLMTFKQYKDFWGNQDYTFNIVKTAPLLHKNKVESDVLEHCLRNLTWRYHRELNKNINLEGD